MGSIFEHEHFKQDDDNDNMSQWSQWFTQSIDPSWYQNDDQESRHNASEEDELTLEELAGSDDTTAEDEDEDVSEMFARLRKEAKKIQDGD